MTRNHPKIKIAISIDFDGVSSWLGTGAHPDNNTADYSAGYSAAYVGVPRLLRLFQKLDIADKVTWAIPGHSIETFPDQTQAIVASGAEIALHGYAHESASQLTAQQEIDVLEKCIALVQDLTGKPPKGYRAPLYQLNERTVSLLQQYGFSWDSSLAHHDSIPYFLPQHLPAITPIDFTPAARASDWMHPSPDLLKLPPSDLVEIPGNWYAEDATPLQYYPHTPNSFGYVDVDVVEKMWRHRFEWLQRELVDGVADFVVFPLILHPEVSGMAHVVGMLERVLYWLRDQTTAGAAEFLTFDQVATQWRQSHAHAVAATAAAADVTPKA